MTATILPAPLPQSEPDECGVLGGILLNAALAADRFAQLRPGHFVDLRCQVVFKALRALAAAGKPLDVVTLVAFLKDHGQLDAAGGWGFVAALPDQCAAFESHLAVVFEKANRRRLLDLADLAQAAANDPAADLAAAIADFGQAVAALGGREQTAKAIGLADLVADVAGDEELIQSRFLCRGAGLLLVGPTGVGKSSLALQLALSWAAARTCFGFAPTRPLRSLLIQAENNAGDLCEMREGVLAGLGFSEAERLQALAGVHVATIDDQSGQEFLAGIVRPLVREHRPDILWLDPLLSYLGGDVSKQETVSAFLRNGLNPILHEFGCAASVLHHTNKPATGTEKRQWQAGDFAYLGSGSADLANWARAVVAIRSLGSNDVFELRVGKRGGRLGWVEDDGHTRRYALPIAHDPRPGVICWRMADVEEVPAGPGRKSEHSVNTILSHLDGAELTSEEWLAICQTESGVTRRTFYRLKETAEKAKLVRKSKVNSKWTKVN